MARGPQKDTSRDADMQRLFSEGNTLQQIGDRFGITRERVRQILARYGVTKKDGGQHTKALLRRVSITERKDRASFAKHGCSYQQYITLVSLGVTRRYGRQKCNAVCRGIAWGFDLWTWWQVWDASGHWADRGRGHGYVMARKGDCGPYSPENVYIITSAENVKDSYIYKPASQRKSTRKDPAITRKAQAVALRNTGCKLSEIAMHMGVSRGTINRYLYGQQQGRAQ